MFCFLKIISIFSSVFCLGFSKRSYAVVFNKMAAPINSFNMNSMKDPEKTSVVDDFMYGSNVASAHIYIRMGKSLLSVIFLAESSFLFKAISTIPLYIA